MTPYSVAQSTSLLHVLILVVASLANVASAHAQDPSYGDLRRGYHFANTLQAATQLVPSEPTLSFGPLHVIGDGTAIRLRLEQTLISGEVNVGDRVSFEVLDDVVVDGTLIIRGGSIAIGGVTLSRDKRPFGRAGRLRLTLDYVLAASKEGIRLRQHKSQDVPSQVENVGGGLTASNEVFGNIPGGPIFLLFGKGGDAWIPEGLEIVAFVNGNQRVHEVK